MPVTFHLLKWILRLLTTFGKETLFKLDYYEGYNLNFRITKEEAESLLPKNLRPLKLKLLRSDAEPRYYLSWYLAALDADVSYRQMGRIDLFTYAKDENDEYCLFFVSSIMELPEAIARSKVHTKIFTRLFDFFARDSRTHQAAYPHHYTEKVRATDGAFACACGDSVVEAKRWRATSEDERFDHVFVLANSQIYRTEVDRNVNFFNQRFIRAPVRKIDRTCVESSNLEGFHPLCRDLESVHYYGSKDAPSRWYIEV